MNSRRASVFSVMRSNSDSGRATSPIAPSLSCVRLRSGRLGGESRNAVSDMTRLRGFDFVGEQEIVDAPLHGFEAGGAERPKSEILDVDLGLHLPGMRRHHQDA